MSKRKHRHDPLHVFIVDEHDEALDAQHFAIERGLCAAEGITMQHFDAHPDLAVPTDIKAKLAMEPARRSELRAKLSRSSDAIATWITPMIAAGFYQKVVWIRPCWLEGTSPLSDGTRRLTVGVDEGGFLRAKVSPGVHCVGDESYFGATRDQILIKGGGADLTVRTTEWEASCYSYIYITYISFSCPIERQKRHIYI